MFKAPDDIEFLEFFESEPLESTPEEGYFCYKIENDSGVVLIFSFHQTQKSLQIRLMIDDNELALFSSESAREIRIEKDASGKYLVCLFEIDGVESKALIYIKPDIKVKWYTIQKYDEFQM